ncbi:MAG: 2-phospho-L-lactate transferase [Pseudomonadota bacterium]
MKAPVLALAGGVGGAKLAAGLNQVLEEAQSPLNIVVNTGDDFEHLGLHIAPDLDSVMYALSGLNDTERGWGMRDETWQCMSALGRLHAETWFSLGDQDLATHLVRTQMLRDGATLSDVTAHLFAQLGVHASVAPMADQPVRTIVDTDAGTLAFQHYFVREQCAPEVRRFDYAGAAEATPATLLARTLADPTLRAVVICPSNPFISIDPMLAIPGVRDALAATTAPVVAVSPIVGGAAIKGPAAKMLKELGLAVSATGIAEHYGELLDGFVMDAADESLAGALTPLPTLVTQTMMHTSADKRALADQVLAFCDGLT